jgi:HEAT repeat protein
MLNHYQASPTRVAEALLRAASSQSPGDASLRRFAAERLWEHAADLRFTDSDSVAALKDLLADRDPSVRSLAARCLHYGGHYQAE